MESFDHANLVPKDYLEIFNNYELNKYCKVKAKSEKMYYSDQMFIKVLSDKNFVFDKIPIKEFAVVLTESKILFFNKLIRKNSFKRILLNNDFILTYEDIMSIDLLHKLSKVNNTEIANKTNELIITLYGGVFIWARIYPGRRNEFADYICNLAMKGIGREIIVKQNKNTCINPNYFKKNMTLNYEMKQKLFAAKVVKMGEIEYQKTQDAKISSLNWTKKFIVISATALFIFENEQEYNATKFIFQHPINKLSNIVPIKMQILQLNKFCLYNINFYNDDNDKTKNKKSYGIILRIDKKNFYETNLFTINSMPLTANELSIKHYFKSPSKQKNCDWALSIRFRQNYPILKSTENIKESIEKANDLNSEYSEENNENSEKLGEKNGKSSKTDQKDRKNRKNGKINNKNKNNKGKKERKNRKKTKKGMKIGENDPNFEENLVKNEKNLVKNDKNLVKNNENCENNGGNGENDEDSIPDGFLKQNGDDFELSEESINNGQIKSLTALPESSDNGESV